MGMRVNIKTDLAESKKWRYKQPENKLNRAAKQANFAAIKAIYHRRGLHHSKIVLDRVVEMLFRQCQWGVLVQTHIANLH